MKSVQFTIISVFIFLNAVDAVAGSHALPSLAASALGIIDGRPLDERDEMFGRFVRISKSGDPNETDCSGFVFEGCVVTGKHCAGDVKKMSIMQGNENKDMPPAKIGVTDIKYLGGEARKDVENDVVIIKTDKVFSKKDSFTLDDIAPANPQTQLPVVLGGSGYRRSLGVIEIKDGKQTQGTFKLGKGQLAMGVNTVIGVPKLETKKIDGKDQLVLAEMVEAVNKEDKTFAFAVDGERDFGHVDEADSGGPVFSVGENGLQIAGLISQRAEDLDPAVIGKKSLMGVAVSLSAQKQWLADQVKALGCTLAAE